MALLQPPAYNATITDPMISNNFHRMMGRTVAGLNEELAIDAGIRQNNKKMLGKIGAKALGLVSQFQGRSMDTLAINLQ